MSAILYIILFARVEGLAYHRICFNTSSLEKFVFLHLEMKSSWLTGTASVMYSPVGAGLLTVATTYSALSSEGRSAVQYSPIIEDYSIVSNFLGTAKCCHTQRPPWL